MRGLTDERRGIRITWWVFYGVVALNLAANRLIDLRIPFGATLELGTKPLLVPLLGLQMFLHTRGRAAHVDLPLPFLYLGLGLGWLGDVFLLLPAGLAGALPGGAFSWGLGAFLLGHLCYIRAFLKGLTAREVLRADRLVFALPLGFYGYLMFSVLRPHLGSLTIPVACYLVALLMSSFSALSRRLAEPREATASILVGSIFFVLSDSILAANRFLFAASGPSMPLANEMIMLTYVLAQGWIVRGVDLEADENAAGQPELARLGA